MKKTNIYKSNKGITLIALIITIIVLLILAGVTISMVTGDKGVLTKAKESSLKTREAEAKEKVGAEVLGSHDESGQINIDDLNSNLMNNLKEVQLKAKDGSYSLLTDSNKIKRLPATVKYNGFDVYIPGTLYLADVTEIGDYVDIGLPYTNGSSYSQVQQFSYDSRYISTGGALTGWRVIGVDGEGEEGVVKLVSAGCPLSYYHSSGSSTSTSISNLSNLYKSSIYLGNTSSTGFYASGFDNQLRIVGSINLRNIIDGCKYINSKETVHALTADEAMSVYLYIYPNGYQGRDTIEEIEDDYYQFFSKAYLKYGDNWDSEKQKDILAIGQNYYLGGTAKDGSLLYGVRLNGNVSSLYAGAGQCGVRVVVTLNKGIEVNDETGDGSLGKGWKLKEIK